MACFVDGNYSAKLLGLFDKLVERRTLGSRLIREVPPVSVEFAKELPDDDAPVQPPVTKRNPNAHFAREGKLRLVTRAQLDQRTLAARQFDAMVAQIRRDCGDTNCDASGISGDSDLSAV